MTSGPNLISNQTNSTDESFPGRGLSVHRAVSRPHSCWRARRPLYRRRRWFWQLVCVHPDLPDFRLPFRGSLLLLLLLMLLLLILLLLLRPIQLGPLQVRGRQVLPGRGLGQQPSPQRDPAAVVGVVLEVPPLGHGGHEVRVGVVPAGPTSSLGGGGEVLHVDGEAPGVGALAPGWQFNRIEKLPKN